MAETGGRARSLTGYDRELADVVVFTDGYFPDPRRHEDDQQPRVGYVVFNRRNGKLYVGKWDVPEEMIKRWLQRQTQIVLIEAFAPVLVVDIFGQMFKDKLVHFFIDSAPVEALLVKGYSKKEDLCGLAGFFWQCCASRSIGAYVDRVPSDGNPSDGPSRGSCWELTRRGAIRVYEGPSSALWNALPYSL